MALLAGYTILIGTVLGLRYRVFVLPPVIMLGGLLIIAISSHPWSSILIFGTLLQISYLAGLFLKGSAPAIIHRPVDPVARPDMH